MQFLASDALQGRGSGTPDELVAAMYVASELERAGVAPAGTAGSTRSDLGAFLQPVTIRTQTISAPPRLSFATGDRTVSRFMEKTSMCSACQLRKSRVRSSML